MRAAVGAAFGMSSVDRLPAFGLSGDKRTVQTGRGLVTLTELEDWYFFPQDAEPMQSVLYSLIFCWRSAMVQRELILPFV
jgi:hypothetical protein